MTSKKTRRIDHLVIPSRDLAALARFWAALGFTVGGRNRHPWGTENHIIQFDGTFLELIGVGEGASIPPHAPGRFSFGAHVAQHLAGGRAGMSMLVLDSEDARRDAADFARRGLGDCEPFFFERKGTRPDGSAIHVAFTLAFAHAETMPDLGFFVCQQHFPEAFWNPAAQIHANGATSLRSVTLVSDDPGPDAAFLAAFADGTVEHAARAPTIATRAGDIVVVNGDQFRQHFGADAESAGAAPPRFAALTFTVADTDAIGAHLAATTIAHRRNGQKIIVPAAAAHGICLVFEASP
jgi:Glyoxalase-like domain